MFSDTVVSLKSVMDTLTPIFAIGITIFLAICAVAAYFLKRLVNQVDAIAKDVKPIRPAIIELQGLLTPTKLKRLMFPLTVEPGSPLKVTEYGDKLLTESGFYVILENESAKLIKAVKDKRPKTNYDIQESSLDVIKELLEKSDPMLVPLKSYAFNNGLEIETLIPPAGVTLRDEVMKTMSFDS